MALLDNVVKQRMVGALVLVALAVIFLPMLFSREDELRQVRVEAPAAPTTPVMPQVQVEPVQVPEPVPVDEPVPTDSEVAQQSPNTPSAAVPSVPALPSTAVAPATAPAAKSEPVKPAPAVAVAPAVKPAAPKKVDANGLPVSWSVQLASLSNRASADNLQKSLRSQGYNAYIRSADGMNRVFVGPLIERAEAERLRDLLSRQQKLNGFVVRFQPERN
ncbi:rare lipoprotein A [compost metagenome]